MNYKISVIIAAYNEEKYIDRCLNSLINQTYNNIEILVIDDGSTDNMSKIINSYLVIDQRIKYFYKKNEGQGIARNYGLKKASGDYVTFVDADDYVEINMYKKMIEKIVNDNADAVISNWSIDYKNGDSIVEPIGLDQRIYENDEIDEIIIPNIISTSFESKKDVNISGSAAKTLYKKMIIDKFNISFTSEKKYTSEDIMFNVDYYLNSKRVYILDENLYHYCQIDGSYSHSYKKDLFSKSLNMYYYLNSKMKTHKNVTSHIRIQKSFFNNILLCILQESRYGNNSLKNIKEIVNNEDIVKLSNDIKKYKMPIKKKLFSIALRFKMVHILNLMCKLNK